MLFKKITRDTKNTSIVRTTSTEFIESESYEKGFADYYNSNIKPLVESFENSRLNALETARKHALISTILFVILAFITSVIASRFSADNHKNMQNILGGILLAAFAAGCAWVYIPIYFYKQSVKSDIFSKIFSFLGNFTYSPLCPNLVPDFLESGIIPYYDKEQSEDAIAGDYNTVNIDLFETTLTMRRTKNTSIGFDSIWLDLAIMIFEFFFKNYMFENASFRGIVIHLSMHKKFTGKTIIKRNMGSYSLLNTLKETEKLETVTLEDPNFGKIFAVYSTDQVEARYLLTTAFMDRLVRLREYYGGSHIECSFYNDKLLMMIPEKQELFEPGSIFKPVNFVDDTKKVLGQMQLIFQIVDMLKLNQNIGM